MAALEAEADRHGELAAQGLPAGKGSTASAGAGGAVQLTRRTTRSTPP